MAEKKAKKEDEEKWWEKIPGLSQIVNAVLWMFGKK